MSKHVYEFVNSFGHSASEAALWVAVIKQAKIDLKHKRVEVREDAESFLFDADDDRLPNLLNMLGLDGDFGKNIVLGMLQ